MDIDWDWDKIIWKKVRKIVFSLQKRIYKATKSGKKARKRRESWNPDGYVDLEALKTA